MKGYVSIPNSIYTKPCKYCGARPIIALTSHIDYVVRCPNSDTHYKTQPGLIDVEDWNIHNTLLYERDKISNRY
ncbi:hypothetical protein [Mucilaginibacter phyllosphaerae]